MFLSAKATNSCWVILESYFCPTSLIVLLALARVLGRTITCRRGPKLDGRLAEVHHNFDVYMLGKLFVVHGGRRASIAARVFDRPENDLTVLFRGDPAMYMVKVILKRCVVEREAQCQTGASDLVLIVSTYLSMLERGGQLLHVGITSTLSGMRPMVITKAKGFLQPSSPSQKKDRSV